MAAPKITLVPYLQTWAPDTRVLSIRLLVAPTGNPLEPLLAVPPALPAFADSQLAFRISISDSIAALPQRTLIDQTVDTARAGVPDARAIFTAIKAALPVPDGAAGDTFAEQAPDTTRKLKKYLPRSYRQSFDFVQPRTSLAVLDDSYHCLIQCPPDTLPPLPENKIGWGEAIAFALRRPRLAEALGLIVPIDVTLDAAPRLEHGGWLWAELSPGSDYTSQAAMPGFQRSFATRVPELPVDATRPIFTPAVFPVSDSAADAAALGSTDKVFAEAIRFDDGFSKIVHVRQPLSVDPLDEDGTKPSAPRDQGVQMAWDDEDILEGQNRALGAQPDGENNVLAPRGVLGYRVDVRELGSGSPGPWTSLSKVLSPFNLGVDLGTAVEERWTEVHPTQHGDQLWLPPWYVSWRGGSLVMSTNDDQRLMNAPPTPPESDTPVDADTVELRYGRSYEIRARMADATGGGPAMTEDPVRLGEAPVANLHMKRHLPPRRPIIEPPTPAADGSVATIRLRRPPLGFPEAVFASGSPARASLLAQIAANDADVPNATPPFIRDPDTPHLRIRVLLRVPTYDPAAEPNGWVEWYSTSRPFPTDPSLPLDLSLTWVAAADYRDVDVSTQSGADGMVTGPLLAIRSRDLRLEFRALGRNDLVYFGSDAARLGDPDAVELHATVASEDALLTNLPPADQLRSVFLRADPVATRARTRSLVAQNDPSIRLVERLASAADLSADGTMLLGRKGERVAFGCVGLSHHAAPDASSLEFGAPAELAGQWINVVQAMIDRDWTWRGQNAPIVSLRRTLFLPRAPGGAATATDVGEITLMNTINVQAADHPERGYIRLIFIDAFPPPLGSDGLPYEADVTYDITIRPEAAPHIVRSIASHLPVATPPTQVPKVKAAGIALTSYVTDDDYAETGTRIKRLWLEFDAPLKDRRDDYFAKALHRTVDPMLVPNWAPVADPVALDGTPLDPELVRVITPGQVEDLAGLNAMQPLEPAGNSDRHFLVPLPPNTDPASPELFAFFTYEIRVGHGPGAPSDPFWSTAQARFGEPLVLDGVQHPAPELACQVFYGGGGAIAARAPYATPYAGQIRVASTNPNTKLWFVLYARVMQADGQSRRNVQIGLKEAHPVPVTGSSLITRQGEAHWTEAEIFDALDLAGLDRGAPLTVLAVELLPEPNGSFHDPLGGDLGQVRILRTSPLHSVERDCCA